MEALQLQQLQSELYLMNSISIKFRGTLTLSSTKFRRFCVASSPNTITSQDLTHDTGGRKRVSGTGRRINGKTRAKVSDAQLKENWLDSLSCPFPSELLPPRINPNAGCSDAFPGESDPQWVLGIDPDVSGALALLKPDDSGCSAQVFDSPHLKVLIGKRTRRRLDAKAIVHMVRSFDAPVGTTAYIEQSIPYPQDGKQGWWSGGFGYGLWIGILVASGFSVVPVPSAVWKNEFRLCGSRSSKDDSREAASTLFPSVSCLLTRKKDHGRAEALLIAAYGKGLKMSTNLSASSEKLTS